VSAAVAAAAKHSSEPNMQVHQLISQDWAAEGKVVTLGCMNTSSCVQPQMQPRYQNVPAFESSSNQPAGY
jgi:hypothetical protein